VKVLLCAIGTAGDVHPLLGLGLALQRRGHQPTIVTNPYFAEVAARLGLPFLPLGTRADFEGALRDPDVWHPTRGFATIAARVIAPGVAPLYRLIAAHDPAETVLFASGLCFGARIAQEHLGFRLLTHYLAPTLLWSRRRPPVMNAALSSRWPRSIHWGVHRIGVQIADRALAPAVNDLRRSLGLRPVRDVVYTWANSPDGIVGLFPDWYAPPQSDWPRNTCLTTFPLYDPADADAGELTLDALGFREPPLVFTPGSGNFHARRFFVAAIAASQALGRPALLLTRHRDHLPAALPAGIVHRDYIPLGQIAPRAAALIDHGGIGSVAQGLAAGVPQLIMPMSHDQPDNADRLRQLGVGAGLPPARFTGPRVAAALDRLLGDPVVGRRCRDLAARCDPTTALDATVARIEAVGR
jgi:rhamnosyltransferase subunit B